MSRPRPPGSRPTRGQRQHLHPRPRKHRQHRQPPHRRLLPRQPPHRRLLPRQRPHRRLLPRPQRGASPSSPQRSSQPLRRKKNPKGTRAQRRSRPTSSPRRRRRRRTRHNRTRGTVSGRFSASSPSRPAMLFLSGRSEESSRHSPSTRTATALGTLCSSSMTRPRDPRRRRS